MKLALISDIHHDPLGGDAGNALPIVEAFVQHAQRSGADAVLDLGDRIVDHGAELDAQAERAVAGAFAALRLPRLHVCGNHDVENLSVADNAAVLGQPLGHRVVDLGEARLILWEPDVRSPMPAGLQPTGTALAWLVDALLADERPAIIATHVPVSGASQVGNRYFENNARYATYPDHAEIRAAVEHTGRAAAWISGHVHRNSVLTVRGIHHLTLQSATERPTAAPEPAGAHAELAVRDGALEFTVHGRDPFHVQVPFARSGAQAWKASLPPFATLRATANAHNPDGASAGRNP